MSKSKNKELKALYLQNEREKYLEKLAASNDPIEKAVLLPPKKEITIEYILAASNQEFQVELLKKIHEELEILRRTHRKNEAEAKMMLHPYKRMLLFTSTFEDMTAMGDADKFLYGTAASDEETDEAINGYLLLNLPEPANLLIEAKSDKRLLNKIEAYFTTDRLEKIREEKMNFIRRHPDDFVYK